MKMKKELSRRTLGILPTIHTHLLSTCWFDVDILIHVDQIDGGQRVEVLQTKLYERGHSNHPELQYLSNVDNWPKKSDYRQKNSLDDSWLQ